MEAFLVICSALAVEVNDIVDSATVVSLENSEVDDVLVDIKLVCDAHELVATVFIEYYNVVDVGAVANEFGILKRCAGESSFAVEVEAFVSFCHFGSLDAVKIPNHRTAREPGAVFLLEMLVPLDCEIGDITDVVG